MAFVNGLRPSPAHAIRLAALSGGPPVNRPPFRCPARRPRPPAALFLLLAALPSAALAQKPVAKTPTPTPPASFPATAGPPAPSQKAMLAGDSRLDRPVSLDLISVPLGEVLQQESLDKSTNTLEDEHRFLLTAAPDCADLKTQIRLNGRPLRVLMTALAQMVPGVWTRTPHGYQLSMTREATTARSEWWSLFLGERAKALAAQHRAVLAAMQTKAKRRQIGDPEPEASDHAVEEEVANQHDFFHTLPPALKEQIAATMDETPFYKVGELSYDNGREQFGTVGWLSQMPPETQERFKGTMQDYITNHLAPAPPALQKYATQARQDLAAFDPSRVYFLFQNYGFGVMATPFNTPPSASPLPDMHIPRTEKYPALSLNQKELADEVYGGTLTGPGWKKQADDLRKKGDAAPEEWKFIMYMVYGMGDAAPEEWKQLAAYQRSRVWPNTLPKIPPRAHDDESPMISRAARTDWLGERGHMEYVCDYYSDYISNGSYAMPAEQKKLPVTRPLATELNEIAARHDVSWSKSEDGVYLVRNNRWYRDDGLEAPQPLLRRWFALLLQTRRQDAARAEKLQAAAPPVAPSAPQPALPTWPQSPEERTATMKQTWDWAAEVFGALTPWQIYNGLAMFQPEERDLAAQNDASEKRREELKRYIPPSIGSGGWGIISFNTQRPPFNGAVGTLTGLPHTVQLYASLDDAQRTALLEGRLPVSALSPSQLAQAISLQPLLPQAMQQFPPPSVFLGLLSGARRPYRVVFGDFPWMRLEVSTPPTPAPQSAP